MINPRILVTVLIAAVLLVITGSQNVMAFVTSPGTTGSITSPSSYPEGTDVDVEEAAEAGNATMTAGKNQTADGNMTRTD